MKRFILFFLLLALTATTVSAQPGVIRRQQNTTKPTTPTKPNKPTKPTKPNKPTKPTTPARTSNCPDGNHPHLIDLGLPSGTKWACCNVDAKKPEDYGGYYAWGETATKSEYNWKTYKYCDGDYNSCHDLGSSICGTQYDVAHVKWCGSWQMPTKEQIIELKDKCKHVWTTQNGVKGRKFTGPNGRSIFLPAAGYRWDTYFYGVGSDGYYWSGAQNTEDEYNAYGLNFNSDDADWYGNFRLYGYSVRPVAR